MKSKEAIRVKKRIDLAAQKVRSEHKRAEVPI